MKSMKKLVLAMMLVGFVCLGMPKVYAADNGSIGVTVTLAEAVEITVAPGTWALTGVALATTSAASETFTVSNLGNVDVDLAIKGTDSVSWTLAGAAAPDAFKVAADINAVGTWLIILGTDDVALATGVAEASGTLPFTLKYSSPTTDSKHGVDQGFTITVTATTAA